MGIYSDKIFPWVMDLTNPPGLDEQRALALRSVGGEVLEIGLGTGASLRFYPNHVRTITAVEPSGHMSRRAARRAAEAHRKVVMHRLLGERLPFADRSFDAVVSILVLCSVGAVPAMLAEVARVLRRDGKFFFLEHVASANRRVRAWQARLNPLQRIIACGCELMRDTERAIRAAGFDVEELEHANLPGMHVIYPLIRGIATKAP